ncbi:hypothetical protein VP01_903g3 [Puccinia sorghi]|uniref:Uncharacterized protein n=1 Tax=Puccinia sorghi TaxID=27349 RepID=A0A0L6U7R0_9BASI|nr:hypothetical protein VP01_903g3 [Puccinia sorghi]
MCVLSFFLLILVLTKSISQFEFVVKSITGSSAWRHKRSQSFIEKKLNQAIVDIIQLEQISRQIRKQNRQLLGHFKEIQFTQADWMQIKHLNDELEVSDYKI